MGNKFAEEELLEISFHDSYINDIRHKEDKLILIIDIDTYWFPGKPFGILTLEEPEDYEKLMKAWQEDIKEGTVSDISIKRKSKNGKYQPVCYIELIDGSKFDIPCNNFWLDRLEKFEKYTHHHFS